MRDKRIWSTCQKKLLRFLYAYEYAYAICEKNVTGAEYSLKKNVSDFFKIINDKPLGKGVFIDSIIPSSTANIKSIYKLSGLLCQKSINIHVPIVNSQ